MRFGHSENDKDKLETVSSELAATNSSWMGKATRIVLALVLSLSMCFTVLAPLYGCQQSTTAASSTETKEVTDCAGRTVQIPVECNKIAALDAFSGEALVMVGAGDKVCAVTGGVASDVILQQIDPDLASLPVPMSSGSINIESLASLSPDVVLVKSSLYGSDQSDKLDQLGIPYLVIGYTSIDEQIQALQVLSNVLSGDSLDKMNSLIDYYQDTVAKVEQKASQIPDSQKVKVYHSINQTTTTDGVDTLGADWITKVGAIDVSADQAVQSGETDYNATLEQVFVWNPDVIICNDPNAVQIFTRDSKWAGLGAVSNGNVYMLPIGATRWGQRGDVETYFAMLWLGKTIYPDYYADVDLQQEVTTIYHDILGVDVDDALYQQMLSGQGMRKTSTGGGQGDN